MPTHKEIDLMNRLLIKLITAAAALGALLAIVATPASAASQVALNAECSPGIAVITAATSAGPTVAQYAAPCTGSCLGQAIMTGTIYVQGPEAAAALPALPLCTRRR
jgi:hypothetical protein